MSGGMNDGNVLFNDAVNTFYLQIHGIGNMVNDHRAREKTRNCHYMGYSFQIAGRNRVYSPPYIRVFVIPVVEHWLKREIAQWVHHEGSIRRRMAH